MVGKYVDLTEAYKSLIEALVHGGIQTLTRVNIHYIDSEDIEKSGTGVIEEMDAILVPGGFGERGVEGKIQAIRYARENKVPYLGICLGMQMAVVEYARHVAGLTNAHSTELDPKTPTPVVALITEWTDEDGKVIERDETVDLGGTMRLGGQGCLLAKGSKMQQIYGQELIRERHRHRYEVNDGYIARLEAAGLKISGRPKTETWSKPLKSKITLGLWPVSSTLNLPPRHETVIRCLKHLWKRRTNTKKILN